MRPAPQFHRVYDSEKDYSLKEMSEHFSVVENQADRLAAAILMPQFTVDRALMDFHKGRRIVVYGQNVIADREQKVISRMAAQIGVSYTAGFDYILKPVQLEDIEMVLERLNRRLSDSRPREESELLTDNPGFNKLVIAAQMSSW